MSIKFSGNDRFGSMFQQLEGHNVPQVTEPRWLLSTGCTTLPFTQSQFNNFSDFSEIFSFKEELKIINTQVNGEKGIYAANVVISIPRNNISVLFFNAFCSKSTLDKLHIIELFNSGENSNVDNAYKERQRISYSTCRVESYKNNMTTAEISINYKSRKEKYHLYTNGVKQGSVQSSFS